MSDVGTSAVGIARRTTSSSGSSVDIDLTNVPRTELAYQVGDIVADRYLVAEVLQSQRRTTVCRVGLRADHHSHVPYDPMVSVVCKFARRKRNQLRLPLFELCTGAARLGALRVKKNCKLLQA